MTRARTEILPLAGHFVAGVHRDDGTSPSAFRLNRSAAEILGKLLECGDADAVSQWLGDKYGIPPEKARSDVQAVRDRWLRAGAL